MMGQHLPNVKLRNKLPQPPLRLEAGMPLRLCGSRAPWTNFSLKAITHRGRGHMGCTSVMVVQTPAAPRSRAGPACAQRWCGHVSSGILRDKSLCSTWRKLVALQALSGVLLLGDPIHWSPIKDLPKHLEMVHTKEILGSNEKKIL